MYEKKNGRADDGSGTDLRLCLGKQARHKVDGLVSERERQVKLFRQTQQPIV